MGQLRNLDLGAATGLSSHANAARSIELVLRDGAENDLYARDEARGSLSLFMKRL